MNTRTNEISNENNNDTHGASNITSCQERSVNSVQNITELVFPNSCHCSDHLSPCTIEDEQDNVHQTIVDNFIP